MLTLAPTTRIWMATEPVSMRLSFRGLAGLVRGRLLDDPTNGHLFCFLNTRRTMIKLLLFDQTGAWIFHKKLSRGTFEMPGPHGQPRVHLEPAQLALILEGIELGSVRHRKRYYRPMPQNDDSPPPTP